MEVDEGEEKARKYIFQENLKYLVTFGVRRSSKVNMTEKIVIKQI